MARAAPEASVVVFLPGAWAGNKIAANRRARFDRRWSNRLNMAAFAAAVYDVVARSHSSGPRWSFLKRTFFRRMEAGTSDVPLGMGEKFSQSLTRNSNENGDLR